MAKDLIEKIKVVLANTYSIYLKTQNYHWNITGPNFQALHSLFEQQYINLATAVDDIAERIRAVGGVAPGGFEIFSKLRTLKDGNEAAKPQDMLKDLCHDHELILENLTECFKDAQESQDEVTMGILIERMTFHEKALWMIKSSL